MLYALGSILLKSSVLANVRCDVDHSSHAKSIWTCPVTPSVACGTFGRFRGRNQNSTVHQSENFVSRERISELRVLRPKMLNDVGRRVHASHPRFDRRMIEVLYHLLLRPCFGSNAHLVLPIPSAETHTSTPRVLHQSNALEAGIFEVTKLAGINVRRILWQLERVITDLRSAPRSVTKSSSGLFPLLVEG